MSAVPAGAVDCHGHVFGPRERFPLAFQPNYEPPVASWQAHEALRAGLGVARAVIVQPSPYAGDNGALLDALDHSKGALVGIAAANGAVTGRQLDQWTAQGVRGLRYVETRAGDGALLPGAMGIEDAEATAPLLAERGWHAELWSSLDRTLALLPRLEKLGVPVALDHMGGFNAAAGVDDVSFQSLLAVLREGQVWVKLTLCRRVPAGGDYAALRQFHDALIEANPDRVVWGSDWPFVRMSPAPDAKGLLDLFLDWVGDAALIRKILVENPARLYRLEATP